MNGRRLAARCVLVALAPLTLDGCLSIGVDQYAATTPAVDARCSFEARLYEKGKDAKNDVRSAREVTWKLFHLDASPVVPVQEGKGATWSVTDLKAGKYRIAATWGSKPGVPGDTSAGSGEETFSLKAGETAQARFVLSKFPTWAWVVIGAVVVAAIIGILAAVFSSEVKDLGTLLSSNDTPGLLPAASAPSSEDVAEEAAAR
jgi:hypothetical protein